MSSYNRCILVGNVTRDIELKHIPSGTAVCELGLAVNDKRKNASGEWVEEATFIDCTLFGRTAEVASEYLRKGASVLIEGRLKLDTWDDKESGKKRSKLKVIGERMQMLGNKQDSQPASQPPQPPPQQHPVPSQPKPTRYTPPDPITDDSSIPF